MKITETVWLNSTDICSLEHVIDVSGIQRRALFELMELGIVKPTRQEGKTYYFHTECIVLARQAKRLQEDFDLTADGLALAMNLLGRIRRLEARVEELHARLPGE